MLWKRGNFHSHPEQGCESFLRGFFVKAPLLQGRFLVFALRSLYPNSPRSQTDLVSWPGNASYFTHMNEGGSHSDESLVIVLDAMGGDYSPKNEVLGTLAALKESGNRFKVILVGNRSAIERDLAAAKASTGPNIEILEASEIITMDDEPVAALRQKKDSSIVRGLLHVQEGKAQAFVSAGNTGAVMSGATLLLGRIKGVSRPTIGSQFPRSEGGYTLVFDVGATVDSKAIHLREYAVMGSIYAEQMFGVKNPKVGLLSVGEESTKGNELVFEAAELIRKTGVNFVGNVEGRDVLKSTVDVIVCDGFVGNIVLKFAESIVGALRIRIRKYAEGGVLNKLRAAVTAIVLRSALKDYDYQEYGGVPLLGVKGITIIGHGSSTPKAIKNMLLKAEEMFVKRINEKIASAIIEVSDKKV
jgi:glycerol-3-phosphate acyltransferase PlsX